MPNMTLNRNHLLSSTSGHMIRFERGKPVYVVPDMVEAALGIGAEPVDEDKVEVEQQLKAKADAQEAAGGKELTGVARTGAIREQLEIIMSRNRSSDFTAAGRPKLEVLKAELNFDVSAKERDVIWDSLMEERSQV